MSVVTTLLVLNSDLCVTNPHSLPNLLFFSDQEPPYSMITLHEMAETGKGP